jgi:hypothetical protein
MYQEIFKEKMMLHYACLLYRALGGTGGNAHEFYHVEIELHKKKQVIFPNKTFVATLRRRNPT